MGARNRIGIGLSYRPVRLHRLAESIPGLLVIKSSKILVPSQFFARSLCLPKLQRHTVIHDSESTFKIYFFPYATQVTSWRENYSMSILCSKCSGKCFPFKHDFLWIISLLEQEVAVAEKSNITFHTLRTFCWKFLSVKIFFFKPSDFPSVSKL
jgi:hypothetical protein